jgi:hypothetical protein
MKSTFLTNPHSYTRTQRVSSSHAQSWRDQQRGDHLDAFEGFLGAAVAGALVWAAFACLMVIAWGLMA